MPLVHSFVLSYSGFALLWCNSVHFNFQPGSRVHGHTDCHGLDHLMMIEAQITPTRICSGTSSRHARPYTALISMTIHPTSNSGFVDLMEDGQRFLLRHQSNLGTVTESRTLGGSLRTLEVYHSRFFLHGQPTI
jgi:hypothetical protein